MRALVVAVVVTAMAMAGAGSARADAQQTAANAFRAGEKAFAAGQLERGAELFEEAYAALPHPSALLNAAVARNRAGQRARAAKLYARLLRDAPASDEANEAQIALATLTLRLGRLRIRAASDVEARAVDGVPLDGDEIVWLDPGTHGIDGAKGGVAFQKRVEVPAGVVTTVTLAAPASPAPAPEAATPPRHAHGLPPVFVLAAGGAVLIAGGLTLWSGLDVAAQRRVYDRTGSDEDFAAGQQKQTRTNVLLGVTVGLAVITGAAAVFTDFGAPVLGRSAQVRLGFDSIAGTF